MLGRWAPCIQVSAQGQQAQLMRSIEKILIRKLGRLGHHRLPILHDPRLVQATGVIAMHDEPAACEGLDFAVRWHVNLRAGRFSHAVRLAHARHLSVGRFSTPVTPDNRTVSLALWRVLDTF